MVRIIAAVSEDGALGLHGGIPWDEPADRRRFKAQTMGGTLIMGRRTWASLPVRPLPGRTCLVLSRSPVAGADTFSSLEAAVAAAGGDAWVIGGAEVIRAAYPLAQLIDLTRVPLRIPDPEAVRMPPIPQALFTRTAAGPLPDAPHLVVELWRRREDAA